MTTSGISTFNETRDQIITNALTLLGVVAAGETPPSADITLCASLLNQMVKAWGAQGIHLWTEETGTLYLVRGQASYNLPGANAGDGSGTPVETTLSADGSGSSITVTTTVGMASGDNIGVVLDNGTIFWTTINGTPSSTTVTLTTGLSSAASSGNNVFTYTTALGRPLSIQAAVYRNAAGFDTSIDIRPRQDYLRITQKTLPGIPNIIYYSPQMSTGVAYLWPAPSDVSGRIVFTYLRTIQDFNASGDTPDFPQEWLECLVFNLAVRAAPAYGINLSSGGIAGNPDILRQASTYLEELKAWDCEQPFIQIVGKWDSR